MTTTEMLERRHELYLEWHEPWNACGPEGNEVHAHVAYRATIHDCINMSRLMWKECGLPVMGDDKRLMLDFIAVHFAEVKT